MPQRIPFRRPVHMTTEEWHQQLLTHLPPSARWLSRDQILTLRRLRAPIRPGPRRVSDPRLSVVELVQLCKVWNLDITRGAIEFVTRMPHALVLNWYTDRELILRQAQHFA